MSASIAMRAFHACEWRAEAVVRAKAEGEVAILAAATSSRSGCGEARLVGVGRDDGDQDQRAARDGDPGDLDLLARVALGGDVDRRGQAQQLLHRRADQGRLLTQASELVGVTEQQQVPPSRSG